LLGENNDFQLLLFNEILGNANSKNKLIIVTLQGLVTISISRKILNKTYYVQLNIIYLKRYRIKYVYIIIIIIVTEPNSWEKAKKEIIKIIIKILTKLSLVGYHGLNNRIEMYNAEP